MTACAVDGSPTNGTALLCPTCTNRLERQVAEMPALARELELTLTRQSSTPKRLGGPSADKPLPYDHGASVALSAIRLFLAGWVKDHCERHGRWPADDQTITLAVWLVHHINDVAHHPAAAEIAAEADDATKAARRSIDRHTVEKLYAGRCNVDNCDADLYARPGALTTVCRACGIEHDTQERRDVMLASIEDTALTAGQIAVALPVLLGVEVTKARVQKWAQRGQLTAVGANLQGWPLYRVGDIRDLIQRMQGVA